LLLHASHAALPILNSSKLPPVVDAADLIIFKIIDKTIRNSKFRCLSEATLKQMLRWFPNSKLLLHASHAALPILNSSKLPPVVDTADLIVFKIIDKTIRNSKFRCLSEATLQQMLRWFPSSKLLQHASHAAVPE
jgi:outer membrane protein assembly factor BamD (BamD/ComL family)